MIKVLFLAALCLPVAHAACLPLAGDRILGRDLALAIPAFSSLAPGLTIGYAPAPGVKRIFSVAELGRIARANNVKLDSPLEVCFEIPMRAMTAEETLDAMRKALPPDTELKIVELPTTSIPAGRLEFLLPGLEPTARGSRLWRGSVRYGETLRMPIWARVTLDRKYLAVVASKDLPLNVLIDPALLRVETVTLPLDAGHIAMRPEDVLGRIPKKPVRAGETIPLAILYLAPVVHRGDAIKVEVRSGTARLLFDAVAQSTGCEGELVELRNPDSGRTFHARIQQGGRAVIIVPSRQAI